MEEVDIVSEVTGDVKFNSAYVAGNKVVALPFSVNKFLVLGPTTLSVEEKATKNG